MSFDGMRAEDIAIFKNAAKNYRVFILLRATNPASLRYIGMKGYSAKRLDCKAKTADLPVLTRYGVRDCAGLVVDPSLVGPAAYKDNKYAKALLEWQKFAPKICTNFCDENGRPTKTYFPGGMFYGVQLDQQNPRYGCVMFSASSLISAATYIHGDYDLYAIVPTDGRNETVFVEEKRLGEKHVRSKELLDVQTFLNARIGRPMILHGDQEKYSEHSDEEVYAFFPDGVTVQALESKSQIETFYQITLGGRKTGGKSAQFEPAGGQWQRVR